MAKLVFVDTVLPEVLDRIRAHVPAGCELVVAGPDPEERRRLVVDADCLLVWGGGISPQLLAAAERVRMIQKIGQGVDNIDLEGARRRGIPVCNAGAANTTSVAEHTILLMLAVYRRLVHLHRDVHAGRWPRFEYRAISREISGKKVGIIGLGNIGRKVAQRLQGWECEVAYHDIVEIPREVQQALNVRPMAKDDLLRWADIVTLHVYLDQRSYHLIGARELRLMKPSAILINASRGPVVDESALVEALRSGRLLGAGLDVFEQEPPDPSNPLLQLDNVITTPHVAAGTWDALERTIRWAMENVGRAMRGERPLHIQNGV